MGYKNTKLLIILIVFIVLAIPKAALADCANPVGKEGQQMYNTTYKTMQFCDGTTWWDMRGGGGSVVAFGECQSGEPVVYNSTTNKFECPFDHTPSAFSLTDQTGVELSTVTESNIVQITSIDDATDISISGTGTPAYRICADGTCSGAPAYTSTAGTINNGQYVQLRMTSNAAYEILNSATITIGDSTDQWDVTTKVNDPCAGSPSVGDVCADGSVYAGLSPDGNVPMYVTSTDAPDAFWNNGSSIGVVRTFFSSTTTGAANTAGLAVFGGAESPYQAAVSCNDLNAHGLTDWYLPARDELTVIYTNWEAIGGFASGFYWSASEHVAQASSVWARNFSTDYEIDLGKNNPNTHVRCARK